jgi:hypothetical protein
MLNKHHVLRLRLPSALGASATSSSKCNRIQLRQILGAIGICSGPELLWSGVLRKILAYIPLILLGVSASARKTFLANSNTSGTKITYPSRVLVMHSLFTYLSILPHDLLIVFFIGRLAHSRRIFRQLLVLHGAMAPPLRRRPPVITAYVTFVRGRS